MNSKVFLFLATISLFTNCTNLSEIENRLDKIETTVNELKDACQALKDAYSNGKIISEVSKNDELNGWTIKFSDNSQIDIINGKDGIDGNAGADGNNGITPLLQIDNNGYWTVSYDNGGSFTLIKDKNGNAITSKGDDGKDGNNIRIVIDENGYYCIEIYNNSNPDVIIEKIETSYTSNKSDIIKTIVKDEITNIITITMADGSEYKFNYEFKSPTSIAILNSQPIYMEENETKVVAFRVNPSNAEFKYDVSKEDCEISLDFVNENSRSYINVPINYRLKEIKQVYDGNDKIIEGEYEAYIEDLNKSTAYNDNVALVLSLKNENNEDIQISSSVFNIVFSGNDILKFELLKENNSGTVLKDVSFEFDDNNNLTLETPYVSSCTTLKPSFTSNGKVYLDGIEQVSGGSTVDLSSPITYTVVSNKGEAKSYTVSLKYSGLPVVEINTPNNAEIVSKEDWLENSTMRILNSDGSEDYYGVMNIRGRGNSTWAYPKKPYAIKLEKKAEILGMPEHKRWVLLANWMDRTMLRNNVAFKIGWSTGLAWTPRGQNVEVVLNGKHIGNYFLCEDKKTGKQRINIHELEGNETTPEEITGGYLLELDTYYDEINKFKSQYKNFPYMFKEPDEEVLNDEMFSYMQNYINSMEASLYTPEKFTAGEFKNYIDLESFIDFWIACELTMNNEYQGPKSTYMYKDKGEKLKAGPMWDFDWGTFIPSSVNSLQIGNCLYYPQLFTDSSFKLMVKERWSMWKSKLETIPQYIDEQKELLRKSDEINIEMWPISSTVNGDENMSFDDAVERLKDAYMAKLAFLDSYINGL